MKKIIGRDGADMLAMWEPAEGEEQMLPRTFYGIHVHKFPNLFFLVGPQVFCFI